MVLRVEEARWLSDETGGNIMRFHELGRMICGLAVLFIAWTGPAAAKDYVYGSCVPAADYLTSDALPAMFAGVEKETGGAIKWKSVAGGQLADCKGTIAAVQDRVMEAGLAIPTYVPNLVPHTALMYNTLEFEGETVAVAGATAETLFLDCKECLDEWRKINSLPLGPYASSPYTLYCREPIDTVAGLKNKRVRAIGGPAELVNMSGAVSVGATLPEAVSLLQRGGLDCLYGITEWLKTFGYGDFAKYVMDLSLGTTGPAIGVQLNYDTWKEMTPAQRTAMLKYQALFSAKHSIGNFVIKNKTSLDEVIKTKGVKVLPVGKDFQEWIAAYKANESKLNGDRARGLGVKDPDAVLRAYEKNLVKWRKLEKEIGTDVEKFADVLWKEIYSKIDVNKL
jgi:TRAP-type C4-dicarboxylate transport system substrate-binding protein